MDAYKMTSDQFAEFRRTGKIPAGAVRASEQETSAALKGALGISDDLEKLHDTGVAQCARLIDLAGISVCETLGGAINYTPDGGEVTSKIVEVWRETLNGIAGVGFSAGHATRKLLGADAPPAARAVGPNDMTQIDLRFSAAAGFMFAAVGLPTDMHMGIALKEAITAARDRAVKLFVDSYQRGLDYGGTN